MFSLDSSYTFMPFCIKRKVIDKPVLSFWNLKLFILNDAKMNLQAFKAIND